ncbi:MAG TPA: pyridoxamine 5'-phosphate oxidase family protein [Allosphingosinicella sp.]|jgi:general stress protein 26
MMPTDAEIEAKFWKALRSDMTVMLGLVDAEEGHARPMTGQMGDRDGRGPVWFFTTTDSDLVQAMGTNSPAAMQFASKGHELFASVEGTLTPDNDQATIDHLWNPHVAAWYEGGKDDPKLQLIRFDATAAQIWLNESSVFAGIKTMLGIDPKQDHKDKVANVDLA